MRIDAIEVKLYIEGVLFPQRGWGSFEMNYQKGGTVSANLSIPALPGIRQEDWARSRIHIFWSDLAIRDEGSDWPLLFEGEIIGSSFSKSPGSRHINFSLAGIESYWSQCKFYFYNLGTGNATDAANAPRTAMFFGNKQIVMETGQPGLKLENKFLSEFQNNPDIPMPEMVRRVFKDSIENTNYFFSKANELLKLDQRFAAPRDTSVELLYANMNLFFSQVDGDIAAREADTPISDVLISVLQLMNYQWLINPQPKLITGKESSNFRIKTTGERDRVVAVIDSELFKRLGTTVSKIGLSGEWTDDDIMSFVKRNEFSIESVANNSLKMHTLSEKEISDLQSPELTSSDINKLNITRENDNFLFLSRIRDELKRVDKPATESDKNPLQETGEDQPKDTIAHFLLVPELEFGLPPKCNVIFPNENSSYGFSRNHLIEPTRMMLSAPIIAKDIRKVYYAPDTMSGAVIPEEKVEFVSVDGASLPVRSGFSMPKITSKFGVRNAAVVRPDGKPTETHGGIDFRAKVGTPIFAYDDGIVIHSDPQDKNDLKKGGGNYISIKHSNGLITTYMHLSEMRVKKGHIVNSGQEIGLSGNTGRSSGPHLHFEVIRNGVKVDPMRYINAAFENLINAANSESQSLVTDIPEMSISEAAKAGVESFNDFKFLTPEEQIIGIVPIIDMSMDRVSASFGREEKDGFDDYMSQQAQSVFLHKKYSIGRSVSHIPMPFSPRVACGFPALIVDPMRSFIATITSVTHKISVQGGVEASTICSLDIPRFWDEGDPHFWVNGEEKFRKQERENANGKTQISIPDPEFARFPLHHLSELVPTNSYKGNPADSKLNEVFGGSKGHRKVDELYQGLLGVDAIPYYYAERESIATGAKVSYNQAIDAVDELGNRSSKTIVGYYENLKHESHELSDRFAYEYTRRLGIRESELLVRILGAEAGDGGYTGGPFRDSIRQTVKTYVQQLLGSRVFQG